MSKPSEDLLSAYYDGEVSPSERTAAERRLEASEASRQELADYRQLSALFQDLPRETLSPEFAAEVLQRAERRTLLPAPSRTPRRGGARHPWLWGALPLAATAAVVLVMMSNRQPGSSRSAPLADARHAAAAPLLAEKIEREAIDGVSPLDRESHGPEKLARSRGSQVDGNASSVARFAARPANESWKLAAAEENSLMFSDNLRDLPVGRVIEALDTSGGKINVVKLWVVDRQMALNRLQVLLARNEIPQSDDAAEKGASPLSTGAATSQLVAVYVEASNAQLLSTLDSLSQDQQTFLGLAVQEPFELAAIKGPALPELAVRNEAKDRPAPSRSAGLERGASTKKQASGRQSAAKPQAASIPQEAKPLPPAVPVPGGAPASAGAAGQLAGRDVRKKNAPQSQLAETESIAEQGNAQRLRPSPQPLEEAKGSGAAPARQLVLSTDLANQIDELARRKAGTNAALDGKPQAADKAPSGVSEGLGIRVRSNPLMTKAAPASGPVHVMFLMQETSAPSNRGAKPN